MTKRIYLILSSLLVVAQAVVLVMLLVSVVRTHVLETWIVALAIGLLVILLILCVVPLFIKKKLIVLRAIATIVSLVCIGGGIFAFRYTDSLNSFLDKITLSGGSASEVTESKLDVTKDPFIVYISGSDSRSGLENSAANSDVNIIAVINPTKSKILLASIPRDTYVQLHGTTGLKDKLTHAGRSGDAELSRKTLEDFLDIEIDYTIKVSFDTVIKVVDELDGIEIYSDTEMHLGTGEQPGSGERCNFVVGKQQVDGNCALRFARERKSYSSGDKHRGENQEEVLTAIINKFLSSDSYLLKLPNILEIAADSFKTTFMRDDITSFMRMQLTNHANWQIESIWLDGEGGHMLPTYTFGEDTLLWVMIPYEESYNTMTNKIAEYSSKEN